MTLRTSFDADVLQLTLDRPDRYNAIDPELRDALIEAFDTAPERGARAVLVHGAGKGFCAGADLKSGAAQMAGPEVERFMSQSTYRLVKALLGCPVPVVAAVHGSAAGIGLTLALGADVCIAADDARFIGSFVQRALVPDGAVARLLPRIIGYARAREFLLLGQTIGASEAVALNMISRTVAADDLLDEARGIALEFAALPTVTLGYAKQLLNRSFELDLESFLFEERALQALVSTTDDKAEGVAAFTERREPKYRGR
jgi:2-(1,2-epoxy-1,2-dihydrophenyl)acetyl-CoA isomerase